MRYFQRLRRHPDGTVTRSGAFRRPYDDEPRADQVFHAVTRTWVSGTDVHDAQLGYRDGEFREVSEPEIRDFFAARFPEEDTNLILAAPLPPRPAEKPRESYPTTLNGGARYAPIESEDGPLGALWWSDDGVAVSVQWRPVASRDDVPVEAMEWWSRRLREARAAGLTPAAFVESLPDRPSGVSGVLRRDLAGHVGSPQELRSLAF